MAVIHSVFCQLRCNYEQSVKSYKRAMALPGSHASSYSNLINVYALSSEPVQIMQWADKWWNWVLKSMQGSAFVKQRFDPASLVQPALILVSAHSGSNLTMTFDWAVAWHFSLAPFDGARGERNVVQAKEKCCASRHTLSISHFVILLVLMLQP